MQLGGDRVVVVPDGVYRAGVVTAPHGATNGPYGGWLILVAQHPGQVVVDMLNDPDPYYNNEHSLRMQAGTSRVMFVGISFRNGIIRNYANPIRFWYCDHQDADYQYLAEGRTAPRMFQSYWGADNLEIYGDDFHNGVASPLVFGSGPSNDTIQGIRIYDIDPRFQDPVDPMLHVESMGSPPGSRRNFSLSSTATSRATTRSGAPTPGTCRMSPGRTSGTATAMHRPSSFKPFRAAGSCEPTRMNWQIFGPQAWISQRGQDPYIYVDGVHYNGSDAYQHRDRVDLVDTNVRYGYPAGVTDDPGTAETSSANPALVWRAAHSYDSWSAFFGWS